MTTQPKKMEEQGNQFIAQSSDFPEKRKRKVWRSPKGARIAGEKLAGHVVVKDKRSNTIKIELRSTPKIKKTKIAFPCWKNISEQMRQVAFMIALRSLGDHRVVAYTLNLTDSIEEKIRQDRNPNKIQDTITRILKKHLPTDSPQLHFLAIEAAPKSGRLHIHGAFALPDNYSFEETYTAVCTDIKNKLGKGYRQRYNNKQLKAKYNHNRTLYAENEDGSLSSREITTGITSSWLDYCTKQIDQVVENGIVIKPFAASRDLRNLSQTVWNLLRDSMAGRDTGVTVEPTTDNHLIVHGKVQDRSACSTHNEPGTFVIPLEGAACSHTPLSQKNSIFSGLGDQISALILTLVLLTWLVLPPRRGAPTKFESEDWPKVFLFAREDPLNPGTSLRHFRVAWHQC